MRDKFLFIADQWGPHFGGINTINYDLCLSLGKNIPEIEVGCLITGEPDPIHIDAAKKNNVKLFFVQTSKIFPSKTFVSTDDLDILKAKEILKALMNEGFYPPSYWIGHDLITGNLAHKLKYISKSGCSVVFHHMNYRAYESRKRTIEFRKSNVDPINDLMVKDFNQRKILNEADIVICIGPKLKNSAIEIVDNTSNNQIYQLIPGLTEPKKVKKTEPLKGIVFGRYSQRLDPVKQFELCVAAFSECVDNPDSILTIVGIDSDDDKKIINNIAKKHSKIRYPINIYPYITDRNKLFDLLSNQSCCFMLSSHEGFGLTGWEAIGCCISLIISKNTGLYDFLDSTLSDSGKEWIYPVEIKSTFDLSGPAYTLDDKNLVLEKLEIIKNSLGLSHEKACLLRNHLQGYSMENFSLKFYSKIKDYEKNTIIKREKSDCVLNKKITESLNSDITEAESPYKIRDVNKIQIEILKTVFPNNKIKLVSYSEKNNILFHYYEVEYLNYSIPHLFISTNAHLKNTIEYLLEKKVLNNHIVAILTARKKKGVSSETFRVSTIKTELKKHKQCKELINNVFFIDEYLWKNKIALTGAETTKKPRYYIDQFLFEHDQTNGSKLNTENFVKKYITEPYETRKSDTPVSAIFGIAGVGKTTLCDYFSYLIMSSKIRLPIYISSKIFLEVIKENNKIFEWTDSHFIKSVYDLFNIYCKVTKSYENLDIKSQTSFDINLSCGNLVVIIDGLDEFESVLKDRFDLDSFLRSIVQLNNIYSNCRVILTSRDFHIDKYKGKEDIEIFCLKGFNENLIEMYLEQRLVDAEAINKANKILKKVPKFNGKFTVPLILDLICRTIETQFDPQLKELNKEAYSEISLLKLDYPLDNLIFFILDREIRKQSLEIEVENYIDILTAIEIDFKGSMPKEQFDVLIQIIVAEKNANYKGDIYTPFYVNPLLDVKHKSVRIRYDAVSNLIKYRYLHQKIISCTDLKKIYELIGSFYDGKSVLYEEMIQSNDYPEDILKNLKTMLGDLRYHFIEANEKIKQLRDVNEIKAVKQQEALLNSLKRSISGVLYLSMGIFSGATKPERSDILRFLYNDDLQNIFIFGKFFPLDFRNITIENSEFYNYENISNSLFTQNNVSFKDCYFFDFDSTTEFPFFKKNFFNCITPKSFRDYWSLFEKTKHETINSIREDLNRFFARFKYKSPNYQKKSFDLLLKSYKTNLNVNNFIKVLASHNIISIDKWKLYSIKKEIIPDVEALRSDTIAPPKFQKVIHELLEKHFSKFK